MSRRFSKELQSHISFHIDAIGAFMRVRGIDLPKVIEGEFRLLVQRLVAGAVGVCRSAQHTKGAGLVSCSVRALCAV